jgi:hypothetical protein
MTRISRIGHLGPGREKFTGSRPGPGHFGSGCCDKNGVTIGEGSTVTFLGEQQRIRRVKWKEGTRLIIGKSSWWLMPFTAGLCEVIHPPGSQLSTLDPRLLR